ncbi:hypothetical protein KY343_03365 [Candidatus Woesearchaeota archaeon]|nr:hypothetical protein [Candidatus Woesearchaeota archaeon]
MIKNIGLGLKLKKNILTRSLRILFKDGLGIQLSPDLLVKRWYLVNKSNNSENKLIAAFLIDFVL